MHVVEDTEFDVGVVVGRFQTHELTPGHIELLQEVQSRHDKVVVILGLSPLMVTLRNPLDFESRKQMILEDFPDFIVQYLKDIPGNDEMWSVALDERISDMLTPSQNALLYGSRDSFIPGYTTGRFPTCELEPTVFHSATEVRNSLRKKVRNSADWRAGVVWASQNQYPSVKTTIDAAVFTDDGSKLLLARKKHQSLYRFIGGFSDPKKDKSFESTARREVQEEAQIAITDPQYVGSAHVDDLRYRGEADQIVTILFEAKIFSGRPAPADDIVECKLFDFATVTEDDLVPEHHHLLRMLKEKSCLGLR